MVASKINFKLVVQHKEYLPVQTKELMQGQSAKQLTDNRNSTRCQREMQKHIAISYCKNQQYKPSLTSYAALTHPSPLTGVMQGVFIAKKPTEILKNDSTIEEIDNYYKSAKLTDGGLTYLDAYFELPENFIKQIDFSSWSNALKAKNPMQALAALDILHVALKNAHNSYEGSLKGAALLAAQERAKKVRMEKYEIIKKQVLSKAEEGRTIALGAILDKELNIVGGAWGHSGSDMHDVFKREKDKVVAKDPKNQAASILAGWLSEVNREDTLNREVWVCAEVEAAYKILQKDLSIDPNKIRFLASEKPDGTKKFIVPCSHCEQWTRTLEMPK